MIKSSLKMRETCSCGHLREVHDDLFFRGKPIDDGHGQCSVPGCDCRQFTWVSGDYDVEPKTLFGLPIVVDASVPALKEGDIALGKPGRNIRRTTGSEQS
jgi:hypothetical protein